MTLREFVEISAALGIASRRELESFEHQIVTGAAMTVEDGGDGSAAFDDAPFSHWWHVFKFARDVFAQMGLRL